MAPAASTSVRPRRNDALSALRRETILDAAIRLFGRKGFAATRAEDIAAAARIAKGTVYLYFTNKEAIYTAAVSQAIKSLHAEIARSTPGDSGFEGRLLAAIRVRLEFWPEHEGIYRLLLTVGREPRLRRQTNEVLRTAQRSLLEIFAQAVAAGEIAPGDFAPICWAALDMIRGATERRMDHICSTSTEEDACWIMQCLRAQVDAAGTRARSAA